MIIFLNTQNWSESSLSDLFDINILFINVIYRSERFEDFHFFGWSKI